MKVDIKCECCQQIVSIESTKIKETHLSEYLYGNGDVFRGFICEGCKRKCDNSAFATFKEIRKNALDVQRNKLTKTE